MFPLFIIYHSKFVSYLFLIILAILPSTIWLLLYLRKDVHPESNSMILKVFFYGMLAALPALLIEIGITEELNRLNLPPLILSILYWFFAIALVEEIFKYLVVKDKVLKSPELDEPLDIALYMIIAALGFAALENFLFFLSESSQVLSENIKLASFRFISATFLHALASGTLGFFLALSVYQIQKGVVLFVTGLFLATLLHGLYNFSIIKMDEIIKTANNQVITINYLSFGIFASLVVFILIGLAVFLTFGFKKLKRMKSICKI